MTNVVAGLEFILKYRFAALFVVASIFSACGSTPSPTDAGLFTGGGNGSSTGGGGATGGGAGGGAATGGGSGSTDAGMSTGGCPGSQQCTDASGQGDFACLDLSTSNQVPANAPTCSSSVACATNFDCWTLSQGATTGVCLQRCTLANCSANTDTWANFGQAFFATTCESCHTHNHSGQFSTQAQVLGDPSIRTRIAVGNMPEGTTLTTAQKNRILDYIDCGVR